MLSKYISLVLASALFAFAAPTPTSVEATSSLDKRQITQPGDPTSLPLVGGTSFCAFQSSTIFLTFVVIVGDVFSPATCSGLQSILQDPSVSPTAFTCMDDGFGQTAFGFNSVAFTNTADVVGQIITNGYSGLVPVNCVERDLGVTILADIGNALLSAA